MDFYRIARKRVRELKKCREFSHLNPHKVAKEMGTSSSATGWYGWYKGPSLIFVSMVTRRFGVTCVACRKTFKHNFRRGHIPFPKTQASINKKIGRIMMGDAIRPLRLSPGIWGDGHNSPLVWFDVLCASCKALANNTVANRLKKPHYFESMDKTSEHDWFLVYVDWLNSYTKSRVYWTSVGYEDGRGNVVG